ELGAVVDRDALRVPADASQLVEEAHDELPADAALDDDTGRAARERVDEREDAEAVAIGRRVGHEVHGPAFARPRERWQLPPRRRCTSTPALDAEREPLSAIEPVDSLVVHVHALSMQKAPKRAVARSRPARSQVAHARQHVVLAPPRHVPLTGPRYAEGA